MAINYDVWGSPETWIDGSTTEQKAGIQFAVSSQDTYRELYTQGVLQLNEMDLSASFWGIGKGSIFNMPYYLSPYQLEGETEVAVDAAADNIDRPMILSSSNFAGEQYIRYASRYAPHRTEAVSTTLMSYTGKIIVNYNYQNLFVVPYVTCKASGYTSSTSSYTLYEYIETAKYSTYPEVIAIQFFPYFGNGSVSRSGGSIGIISDVYFPESDLYYGSNTFWSQFGCSILYNTTESGTTSRSIIGCIHNSTTTINNTVGDRTTALAYKYSKAEGTSVPVYFFDPDNDIWTINKTGVRSSNTVWYEYPFINVTSATMAARLKEYALTQIAYLGFPFVYDPANVTQGQIGDTGVYLPVFDENGITTGEYEEGQNALALPNAEWIDGRTGSGYDPYRPIPAGDMDNVTGRNLNFWSSNKYYLMQQDDLDEFLARVNGLYTGGETAEEKAEELRRMQVDFKGSNPSDYIVGLYGLPFQWVWAKQFFQPVMLGPVEILPNDAESDTAVALVNPDANAELLFGEIRIPELGNFLDYEPYTTLMLYVPFCGTCKLDTAEYIGHNVRVVGTLDKHTGELAVRIMRDGQTVTNTMTGNLYVRVPVTAQAMGTYETNLHQLQMAAFNREFGLLTNAVTGGVSMGAAAAAGGEGEGGGSGGMISPTAPISMAASLIQLPIAMADYEFRITHCQPPVFYSSSASSANQAKFYRKAKLFIKRPVFLDTYNTDIGKYVYGHTIGYACCKQVEHINDMTSTDHNHLIKCSNVDLTGIPATADELAAIKKALTQGIYI